MSAVHGISNDSSSVSQSNSEGNGFNSDSSSQINGVEQGGNAMGQQPGGDLQGIQQNLQSQDPLARGNAQQDLANKAIEDFQKMLAENGQGSSQQPGSEAPQAEAQQCEPGSGESTGGAGGSGASPGGQEMSIEDFLKKWAEEKGLSPEQTQKLIDTVKGMSGEGGSESTGGAEGITKPQSADAMFA